MGSQIPELNNNIVNLDSLKNFSSFCPVYLEDIDTLIVQPRTPAPAISVDLHGDLYLRIDPTTKDIVGIEIENFQGYFLAKYPDFAPIWKQMKKSVKRNRCENKSLTTFLTIIQALLGQLVSKQGDVKISLSLTPSQASLL